MNEKTQLEDLDPALQKSVLKAKKEAVTALEDKGLLSLYMGGTTSKDDRVETSDIDLIRIVSDEFDFLEERDLNRHFGRLIETIGCEAKFRGMTVGELQGEPPRGYIAKALHVRLFLKRLPFFVHLWGPKVKISETIGPFSPQEEAVFQTDIIPRHIKRLRRGDRPIIFKWVVKAVLYLSAIEAEIESGYDFDPSFQKVVTHLAEQGDHIALEALRLRNEMRSRQLSEDEKEAFLRQTEEYLQEIRNKAERWAK